MTQYVIQASPLTKIFLPEWEGLCVANPEIIGDATAFTVRVPRSTGAILLEHNKPIHVSTLIRYNGLRKVENDETKDVLFWLCDEMSHETNIWGVVPLEIDTYAGDLINGMLSSPDILGTTSEDQEVMVRRHLDMQKRIVDHMRAAIGTARERANAKVRRQLKLTHHNLIKQWEDNHSIGGGSYPPSATEALGAWILSEEIKKASASKQAMIQNMNDLIKKTKVG